MKKTPLRKCIICGEHFDKKMLIRIVKDKENNFEIDTSFKKNGRGAYVCKNQQCIDKIIKTRALDRAFKMKVEQEIYDKLVTEIKESE